MGIRTADMQAAVDYLGIHPNPLAAAKYALAKARSDMDKTYAQLYPATTGTVKERECQVEGNWEYQCMREVENLAIKEVAEHEGKREWARTICDLYRTVSANNRTLDGIR